jgi:deazaflavin-dependent oxidoreductase (nitroreductase family)
MTRSRRLAYLAVGMLATSRLLFPLHRLVYRLTGGFSVVGRVLGCDMALLTTTGRRSGLRRTAPVFAFPDGDRWVVVASNSGRRRAPRWLGNLRADPGAALQVRRRRLSVRASEASGPERDRLWAQVSHAWPGYDVYAERTARSIPVVVLTPVDPPLAPAP